MAQSHAGGPELYARRVATDLLESFLTVEEKFQSSCCATEQEVIDALRQVRARALGAGLRAQVAGGHRCSTPVECQGLGCRQGRIPVSVGATASCFRE